MYSTLAATGDRGKPVSKGGFKAVAVTSRNSFVPDVFRLIKGIGIKYRNQRARAALS